VTFCEESVDPSDEIKSTICSVKRGSSIGKNYSISEAASRKVKKFTNREEKSYPSSI